MIIRTIALTGLLSLGVGTAMYSPPVLARGFISVNIAPPPPRYERVVVRPGYEWAPGYWRWNGRRYVWAGGRYIGSRPGHRWERSEWVHEGPHWRYRKGGWR